MLYLSGVQSEKVLTKDIIEKVITEVEKKVSELENLKWYPIKQLKNLYQGIQH